MSFIEVIFGSTFNCIIFFFSIFFINIVGILIYKRIAIRLKILSYPNFRTLHESSIPRGAGIVFSSIFVIGVFALWYFNLLSKELLLILGFGGSMATLFGFLDDVYDIRASSKLFIQICLSIWMLNFLNEPFALL